MVRMSEAETWLRFAGRSAPNNDPASRTAEALIGVGWALLEVAAAIRGEPSGKVQIVYKTGPASEEQDDS